MQTVPAHCPTCKTSLQVEYEGHYTAVRTNDCSGCGAGLCDACDTFVCTGCDELFCSSHLVNYDGERACPGCALWWAEQAKRQLDRAFEDRLCGRIR